MLNEAQIEGIGHAMGEALKEQSNQFGAQYVLLEARVAELERLCSILRLAPDASAPTDGAPAKH